MQTNKLSLSGVFRAIVFQFQLERGTNCSRKENVFLTTKSIEMQIGDDDDDNDDFPLLSHLQHRAMLVKLNHNSLTSNKRRRKEDFANIEKIPKPRQVSSSSSSSFRPHYVVLPSPTCSLLLKSIVSGELLIPLDVPPLGNCQENSQQTLESELAAVSSVGRELHACASARAR